jgi:hypothetical protein
MTYPKDSPCETFIQGPPHLDEEEKISHYPLIIRSKLKGLNAYQACASALGHL